MCFNAFNKNADLDVLNHPILNFLYYLVLFYSFWYSNLELKSSISVNYYLSVWMLWIEFVTIMEVWWIQQQRYLLGTKSYILLLKIGSRSRFITMQILSLLPISILVEYWKHISYNLWVILVCIGEVLIPWLSVVTSHLGHNNMHSNSSSRLYTRPLRFPLTFLNFLTVKSLFCYFLDVFLSGRLYHHFFIVVCNLHYAHNS